jgi:hypothetical protein
MGSIAASLRTPSVASSGADRTRTDDPLHAMQVLYQLSYSPEVGSHPTSGQAAATDGEGLWRAARISFSKAAGASS